MTSFLPNMRLLTIPSGEGGADWSGRSNELDQKLEGLGLDLSEESVYLIFSGSGACLIARPVIGPKREPGAGMGLVDWKASPVFRKALTGTTMREILDEAAEVREEAEKAFKKLSESFFIVIQRRLSTKLEVSVEAIFHE